MPEFAKFINRMGSILMIDLPDEHIGKKLAAVT